MGGKGSKVQEQAGAFVTAFGQRRTADVVEAFEEGASLHFFNVQDGKPAAFAGRKEIARFYEVYMQIFPMVELDLGAQAALANKVAKGAGGAEAGDGRQGSVYIDDGESALEQDAGEAPAKGPVVSANLISQVFDDPTRTAVFIYKIPQKGYRFVQESITLSSSGKISHLGITMDSATDFSGLTMLSAAPTAEGKDD